MNYITLTTNDGTNESMNFIVSNRALSALENIYMNMGGFRRFHIDIISDNVIKRVSYYGIAEWLAVYVFLDMSIIESIVNKLKNI